MSSQIRVTIIVLVLGLIAVGCSPATSTSPSPDTAGTAAPTITTSTVGVPPPTEMLVPRTCDTASGLPPTKCYWLDVPERRDQPTSRTIRLWVAVFSPVDPAPDATPAIFLTGGPGITASTPFISGNVTFVGTPRTDVVIDQRGSGRSEPRLDCPELHTSLDATHPWAERVAATNAAAVSCRQSLEAAGIDLDGYNTIESAADIVSLRKALGYDKWIVGGVSYGGRLAREVYRQDPTGVAALILDSAVTTAPVGPANLVSDAESAIQRITAACNAQPTCSSANGGIDVQLETAAKLLDTTPFVIPAGGTSPASTIAGDDLYNGAIQAMYRSDLIPALPAAARSLANGDTSVLSTLAEQVNPPASADQRDDYAVADDQVMSCADEGAAMTPADREVLATPGRWSSLVLSWPYINCDSWGVNPVPGGQLAPVAGDVPVLAVYGQLDPVTPPVFANEILAQFPTALSLQYPGGGHGVLFLSDCATQIALAFYDHPGSDIDTACVASLPQPFS